MCNGVETCQAGRCTAAAPLICGPGLACGADGCQNIDECATGQDDCSPDAICTDGVPSNDSPPFTCACAPGFEGDGRTCVAICDPITVPTGFERCVRARPNGTVDMRFSRPRDKVGQAARPRAAAARISTDAALGSGGTAAAYPSADERASPAAIS